MRRLSSAPTSVRLAAAALAITACAAGPGWAQDARPTTAPATAPTTSPAAGASTRPANEPPPISLDFRDAPLDSVLEHLSEAAGFAIIKDGPVDARVTVLSRQPLSADETVILLNAVLRANGYVVVREGRVLRITGRDAAKKENVRVQFGADPAAIEANDTIVTQVIPIGNLDAVKLRQDLAPLIGPNADVAANGGSNAIIITDSGTNVRRVVQIIAAVDRTEAGNVELRRYPLKHGDAMAAARLIMQLLMPLSAAVQMRAPDGSRLPMSATEAARGRIMAVADERTNTLFVSAQKPTLDVVDGIVRDLESDPSASSEIRIFTLKFAEAASAARLLTAVFGPQDTQPRREGDGRPPPNPFDQALRGRVVAAADDRTNTLVVTAPAATLRIIEQILKQLDADPSQTSEIRVFPLSYADATAAARLVLAIFRPADAAAPNPNEPPRRRDGPEPAVNARVTAAADERTNSLVVTAPAATLKVIENLLQSLDANPAATSVVRTFPLKHTDASEAVYLLNSIFGETRSSSFPGQPQPPPQPGLPLAPTRGRLVAVSDTRTNTVIVQAPAELMTTAEGLLKELEANPTTEQTLFIYRLRNGQAAQMEQVLNVLFGNAAPGYGGAMGRLGAGGMGFPGLGGRAGPGFFGGRGRGSLLTGGGGGALGRSRGGPFGGDGAFDPRYPGGIDPRMLAGQGGNQNQQNLSGNSMRAITELTGEVYVVADIDTNALLITTATKYLDQVKQVIAELDRPVPQVLIKVLVAEVTHDNAADIGVDFSILNRRPSGLGQTVSTGFGLSGPAGATGGLVVQVVESQVNATLRALQTEGRLEVLSRPYILASDNQLASITVGQEVPFVTNTRITDNGQQINTIEYQDVGIILNVTPHVNPDGLVIMDVVPEISQLTSSTVTISEGVTAPVIAKRSAASRVGIRTGNTIVIGGLMEDRKTRTVSKVPILGDVPFLRWAFSRTQVNKQKTELLIFLTPQVAHRPEDLGPATQDETGRTQLVPNAIQPGTFDRHLSGMGREPATGPTTGPASAPTAPPVHGIEVPIRPTVRQPATQPATVPAGG